MAFLLLINTLFWTGLVPFPFAREFSKKEAAVLVAPCSTTSTPSPLKNISVRVFNASGKTGVARQVTDTLSASGVHTSEPANWNSDEAVTESLRIITGKSTIDEAYTLRAFFPDAHVVYDENTTNDVVDVVIGKAWTQANNQPTSEEFEKAMENISSCVEASSL